MIAGRVTPLGQAVVRLRLEAPGGPPHTADAVVDTGFNGFLALPAQRIRALGLPSIGAKTAILADGTPARVRIFRAIVHWHGTRRVVPALEVHGGALIGMTLLRGSRLTMDVVPNGPVEIEPISQT